MDIVKTEAFVEENFEKNFVEPLSDFVRIPNLTPAFDPEYFTNGLNQQAIKFVKEYAESMKIDGLEFHHYEEEGMCPMVVMTYEGSGAPNVMVYGHLDKQPHMEGWREGTGPISPAIIDGKLYGRGASDDGYVPFAVLLAIKNAILQGQTLPRIALVLETEEESGSHDLVPLLEKCNKWIGTPDFCICLDSGALDYSTLWLTTTLRGMMAFNMKVSIAEGAVHSGISGGAIPETFRIANSLLDRLEDTTTRRLPLFEVEIPDSFKEEAKHIAELQGEDMYKPFKFLEGCKAMNQDDLAELYLNVNWRPSLAVTGADGMPPISKSGNVVRPSTTLRVSIRLPPGLDSVKALATAEELLLKDVPHGAKVELLSKVTGDGWCMKELSEKTVKVLDQASNNFYGKSCGQYGIGGSIPFLKVLGDKYPQTEILALGVLGPEANAHAPNETLDLPYSKKFIMTLSHVLAGLA
jgi:acetylornithine deacetylase/succinyl-diaminopimelate desuccinylase-like protein